MKNLSIVKNNRFMVSAIAALAVAFGALSYAQSAPAGGGVIIVDRNAIFNESKAGQDITKQILDLRKTIGDDLGKKEDKLKLEEDQLRGQQSLLTQEAFQAKVKEAQDKQIALQKEADDKSRQLQTAILTAQNKIQQAVSPILDDLRKEKQAYLMIDRAAVVKGDADLDVTAAAIDRLNQKLPTVKVDLAPLPAAQAAGKPAAPAAQQKAPGQ